MVVLMVVPGLLAAAVILFLPKRFTADGINLRAWWLIPLAALTTFLFNESIYPDSLGDKAALRISVTVTLAIVVVFIALNWSIQCRMTRWGLGLVLAGTVCNAIPQWIYGAMPFSTQGARQSGYTDAELAEMAKSYVRNLPITDQPGWVVALSDIIPLPPLMKVLSIGDVLLMAGGLVAVIGLVVAGATATTTAPTAQSVRT